jgi:Mn-dependent DtxR family transcriptional regulator
MDKVIDKLLLEWSWRCEKGYPDIHNPADRKILENLLTEHNIPVLEIFDKLYENNSNAEIFEKKVQSLNISKPGAVIQVFEKLSQQQQSQIIQVISNNYSIDSFEKNIKKLALIFEPFFEVQLTGAGKGELLPLLSIGNSRSGGTAEKDVIVDNQIIEVKELDAGGKFRTGKTGSIRDSKLDENVQTLIKIIRNIPEGIQEVAEIKKKILDYYDSTYKYGSGKPSFFLKDLSSFIELFPKDVSSYTKEDTEDYVKIDGKKYFYTKVDNETVKIRQEVEVGVENIIKLKRHPYYKDVNAIKEDLKALKETYLNSINYLLLYPKGDALNPILLSSEQAKEETSIYDVNQQNARIKYGKSSLEEHTEEYF